MAQKYTRQQIKNELVPKYAKKWGIPVPIAQALINQESGYNPNAVSHSGAQGLGQIMPGTGRSFGLTRPFDPDQNLDVSMHLLRQGYNKYGNWASALASYNAGSGVVDDFLNGTNYTGSGKGNNPRRIKTLNGIPTFKETQNYVKAISAAAGIDKYGRYNPKTADIVYGLENNEYKFFDKDTGLLKAEGVNKLVSGLKEVVGADKLVSIKTNRPELLEDKPQYKAYAGLRAMKTFDGKPLFTKGDTDAFVASFVKEDAPLSSVGTEAIASDMINSQSDVFNPINKAQASSLYELFKNSYAQYKANGAHGMAGLTNQEYMGYGLSPEEVDDPVMQSRVLAQEYQRAEDVLGGENKAICALGGGQLVDQEGNVASWRDIKEQKDAYLKEWKIYAGQDDEEFGRINSLIASYDSLKNTFMEA